MRAILVNRRLSHQIFGVKILYFRLEPEGMTKSSHCQFSNHFAWGAATASYQIEGAVREEGQGLSVWDMICRKPGAIYQGQNDEI